MSDKIWLITGCSTGFGRALTEALIAQGTPVVATARDPSALSDLAKSSSPSKFLALKLDVTSVSDIKEAFNYAISHFGRVDVVVNNAGYGLMGEFESCSNDDIKKLLDVNLWGVMNVTREALRVFREVNSPSGGNLFQITSTGGFVAYPAFSIYHTSKFAVEGFSEAVAQELDPKWGIKITIIEPGGFRTDFAGRSLVQTTLLPAYENSPAATLRSYLTSGAAEIGAGDPTKAAAAIIKMASIPNPPLRLALGPDAVKSILDKLDAVRKSIEEWKELSVSTSFEGAPMFDAKLVNL